MKNEVMNFLKSADDAQLVSIWNEYCRANYYEDELFYMDELDEMLGERKPSEIIEMLEPGFDRMDDWFIFTIYGVKSIDDPLRVIDLDALAEWICETGNYCYDSELRAVLDACEE